MVDKIDRPDAPSPYAVTGTTETKRDKPQDQRGQEDLPTFKQTGPSLYKEKFQSESSVIKTVLVPLSDIDSLKFRRATPRQGAPTVEADLILKDGKTLEGISFLLKNWQDFLQIKNFKIGDKILPAFWNHGGKNLEITLRPVATSGPWHLKEIQSQAAKPVLTKPSGFIKKIKGDKKTFFWILGIVGITVLLLIYLFQL